MTETTVCKADIKKQKISNSQKNKLTRDYIMKAYLMLSAEKGDERISVTEIVKKAGVSRQAFYNNYNSKADVMADINKYRIEFLNEHLLNKEFVKDSYSWFLYCFRTLEENSYYFDPIFSSDYMIGEFMSTQLFYQLVNANTAEEEYILLAETNAFKTVIIEWYKKGKKETPEAMAQMCMKYFKLEKLISIYLNNKVNIEK